MNSWQSLPIPWDLTPLEPPQVSNEVALEISAAWVATDRKNRLILSQYMTEPPYIINRHFDFLQLLKFSSPSPIISNSRIELIQLLKVAKPASVFIPPRG
jgi:hypothetical protein